MWGCRYTKRGEDIHTWDAFVYAWTTSRKWCKEQETVIASGIMNRGWGWMGPGEVAVESLSCVWLCAIPWTVARQAPLSMGFSRQEPWSGVATSFSRGSCWSRDQTCISCITGGFFHCWATGEAHPFYTFWVLHILPIWILKILKEKRKVLVHELQLALQAHPVVSLNWE